MGTPTASSVEFLVNTTTVFYQAEPVIASFEDGRFVVAWSDVSESGGDTDGIAVRAQIFNADGSKSGSEFLVNTTTASDQSEPTITVLANGNFIVAFETGALPNFDVRARLFDGDGTPIGPDFVVNTTTSLSQSDPSITALADGGFVVTWEDGSGIGADGQAVRAQIYDAAGGAVGGEFVVNATTTGVQRDPAVAGLADGGFVVAWRDFSNTGGDTSNSAIRAQVFDESGSPVGLEFLVNTTVSGHQSDAAITVLANGNFVVSWTDSSASGDDTSDTAVRAQVFSASGDRIGSEFVANTTTSGFQSEPDVVALDDGRFVVVFRDGNLSSTIRAQAFNADGTRSGDEFKVDQSETGNATAAKVAVLADGRLMFTWQDQALTGDDTDQLSIRGRIFDPRGEGLTLVGTPGDDDLVGSAFGDSIEGRSGGDLLHGGIGSDVIAGVGGDDTLSGDAGHDTIRGGAGDDNLYGGIGNDLLEGGDDNDSLFGDSGGDTLRGGNGNDFLDGGAGSDEAEGGQGNDTYVLDSLSDTIIEASGGGTDTIQPLLFSLTLFANVENASLGGTGNLDLTGNAAANALTGNSGNNDLSGLDGNDSLSGGEGNDNVFGGNVEDVLDGGGGINTLNGGGGDDLYFLNTGDTVVEAAGSGGGSDTVTAGFAINLAAYANVENATLTGGAGLGLTGTAVANVLTGNGGANAIVGNGGDDSLFGGGGIDNLSGGDGDDSLDGGAGADVMAGGAGNDTFVIDDAGDAVSDSAGVDTVTSAVLDLLLGADFENGKLTGAADLDLSGNALANGLGGNSGNNLIVGAEGNDAIDGNDGADALSGGLGADTLTGGGGGDSFVFDVKATSANADRIVDFVAGTDQIVLDRSVFTKLKLGDLSPGAFYAGKNAKAANDGSDRVIYDTKSGEIRYDKDGAGGAKAKLVAILDGSPDSLGHADFTVVA